MTENEQTNEEHRRVRIREKENELPKRLREVIGDESVLSFSRRSGINESALRKYFSGTLPNIETAVAIADTAGVSIEWLITGRGDKKRNAAVNNGSVVVNGGSMAIGNGNTVHSTVKSISLEQLTKALEITGADPTHAKVVTAVYDLLQSGAPLPQIANLVRVMMPD